MQLAEIHCYPVKSLRGHKVSKAAVESIGVEGDRRWLVVDASGCFQTIRELPRMVQIEAEAIEGGIRMIHGEADACTVSTPQEDAASCDVTIWGGSVRAVAAGAEADAFLSGVLGTKVHLVYLANPKARSIDAKYGGDHLSFADDYPLLVAAQSSLADLCTRAGADIAMGRFRPNFVIAGAAPWEEDTWRAIRIGNVGIGAYCVESRDRVLLLLRGALRALLSITAYQGLGLKASTTPSVTVSSSVFLVHS